MTVPAITTELVLITLLLLLNGVLAMSELAIVSARKSRLSQRAEAGDKGAAAALVLANEPTRFLSTVQIGITLVGILAGAFGGATIAEQLGAAVGTVPPLAPYGEAIGLAMVVGAITFLSLIVGELVPKRLALNNAEGIAVRVARPMAILARVAGPIVTLLTLTTEGVLRLLRVRPSADAAVTEEDVRGLLAEGARVGVFDVTEREMVESVFELGETQVRELMTPRVRVVWLDAAEPPESVWAEVAASPHSSYPVCREAIDDVIGVLSLKALTLHLLEGRPPDLAALARPPLFLPEHMPAFRALEQFKQSGCRVAMVIDEYSSIAGLLTSTDVLEALVGELAPADGSARGGPVRREDGSWLLDGLMPLDEVAELLALPGEPDAAEDVQTLGGLAMARLGRVPAASDRFTWAGHTFEVIDMDGRRVDKVLVLAGQPVVGEQTEDRVAGEPP